MYSEFHSLLNSVIDLQPHAELIIADFVEESGKDRQNFLEIFLPLLRLAKSTRELLGVTLDANIEGNHLMIAWRNSTTTFLSRKQGFPELPDRLPLLFLGSAVRHGMSPSLARLLQVIPTPSPVEFVKNICTFTYWENIQSSFDFDTLQHLITVAVTHVGETSAFGHFLRQSKIRANLSKVSSCLNSILPLLSQ